jgi:serine/threonine-protein kinase HipA
VHLCSALGKDVLLVERFDRVWAEGHWQRRAMVSALTLLELDEMMAAYASYEKLAEIIRHRFASPKATLRELFARIVFNILYGNTDDHARNHAAPVFLLHRDEAIRIVNHQVQVIEEQWTAICEEAALSVVDRALFWRRQFLNPFAFLNAPEGVRVPSPS